MRVILLCPPSPAAQAYLQQHEVKSAEPQPNLTAAVNSLGTSKKTVPLNQRDLVVVESVDAFPASEVKSLSLVQQVLEKRARLVVVGGGGGVSPIDAGTPDGRLALSMELALRQHEAEVGWGPSSEERVSRLTALTRMLLAQYRSGKWEPVCKCCL